MVHLIFVHFTIYIFHLEINKAGINKAPLSMFNFVFDRKSKRKKKEERKKKRQILNIS